MPPRDPELPEGTDHIINGASGSSGAAGSSGGTEGGGRSSPARSSRTGTSSEGGFVAKGDSGTDGATDKLVSQVRDQVSTLRGQATDKLRGLADDGKGRATGLLDNFSEVINDAAQSIDERLGEEYGRYAHQAADAVASFAGRVREKTVDDGRSAVRASPGIAIAAAAVAGFALMRVIRTGIEQSSSSGATGGRRKRANADTTAGGGA